MVCSIDVTVERENKGYTDTPDVIYSHCHHFQQEKTSEELILKDFCFWYCPKMPTCVLLKLGPMDVLEIVKLTNLAAQRCCLLGCPRKLVNG